MEIETIECDVVVIGAGLSGLSAAYYLTKIDRKLRVIVLEAKDRIGGRTFTKQLQASDGSKDYWDIGGEWVNRSQPHIHYLLHKFGIKPFNAVIHRNEDNFNALKCQFQFTWQAWLDMRLFLWKLDMLRPRILRENVDDSPLAKECDTQLFSSYVEANLWTLEAKNKVVSACENMLGLSPSEMTLLFFLMNIDASGGLYMLLNPGAYTGEYRIQGGTQQLSFQLMQRFGRQYMYLEQPVKSIVQSIEGATVTTSKSMQFLCQRVIVAVPPHQAARINMEPALPDARKVRMENGPLTFLVKFVATYDEAFWAQDEQRRKYGFQLVLRNEGSSVGLVYDAVSGRGNPALAGFVSTYFPPDLDAKARMFMILKLIEDHFGVDVYKCIDFEQVDWSQEPFNGGCFLKNMMTTTSSYFDNALRQPFDRIHFAGTETSTVWCGFMNGAIQSGFRAATEVLYHLRPLLVSSPIPEPLCFKMEEKRKQKNKNSTSGCGRSVLKWTMIGFGCACLASTVYLISKRARLSDANPNTFVKNIHLVLKSS